MYKPTTIGTTAPTFQVQQKKEMLPSLPVVFSVPDTFPSISNENQTKILQKVNSFDLKKVTPDTIVTIGSDAERALTKVLDTFLARVNKQQSPGIFELVAALNKTVDQQDLPAIADKIINAKPSLIKRIFSRKSLGELTQSILQDVSNIASGKTKTIVDVVNEIELKLKVEMAKIQDEIKFLEKAKQEYKTCFVNFVDDAALLHLLLEKSKKDFQTLDPKDDHLSEFQDKLQMLESRALAVEGTMTRLPADQIVIRQLQNACVLTLQELSTTMASRFASIKMTLLTLHSTLALHRVQKLGEEGKNLDVNLNAVRQSLMKDVVTAAAHAPGNNRLQQAEQIRGIVAETKQLTEIVDAAKIKNQEMFKQAREMLSQARVDLVEIATKR